MKKPILNQLLEVSNEHIILVEGTNDKFFIISLLNFLNNSKSTVTPILSFNEIGGCDAKKIAIALNSNKTELRSGKVKSLGIIIDIDNNTIENKLSTINEAIKISFPDNGARLTENENSITLLIEENEIKFSYFLMQNSEGTGNTENLLKELITTEPIAANCLDTWRSCLKDLKISDSQFLKEWTNFYLRYDYCADKNLSKHASDNCNMQGAMNNINDTEKANAWDFTKDNSILNSLKKYLSNFT